MPINRHLKIIIDTNLWISFIISNNITGLEEKIDSNSIKIIFSKEHLRELEETIKKPKLKKYFAKSGLEEMLEAFQPYIEILNVTTKVNVCRDPADDFLLATAQESEADFLITGDHDLLSIERFKTTRIITYREFLEIVN